MNTHRQQLLTLGLTALFTLSATGLASEKEEFSQAQRELNIMRSIFGAVLEPDSDTRRFLRNSGPEALYLAGQGMVFTFDLQYQPDASLLNREPSASLSMGYTADVLWRPDAEIAITPAFTLGGLAVPGGSEEQVRLRETMQEKQAELRELQSEIQGLAQAQRENPGDNSEKMKELQQRLRALNAEWQAQRNSYAKLVREERDALIEKRNAEKREQATLLISTLCDYGKNLDSLASDQHITLVFRDFEDNRNQVYVFTQEAVADCSNAENLQQSAVSYQL